MDLSLRRAMAICMCMLWYNRIRLYVKVPLEIYEKKYYTDIMRGVDKHNMRHSQVLYASQDPHTEFCIFHTKPLKENITNAISLSHTNTQFEPYRELNLSFKFYSCVESTLGL